MAPPDDPGRAPGRAGPGGPADGDRRCPGRQPRASTPPPRPAARPRRADIPGGGPDRSGTGRRRPGRISGGSRTSPTCGRWPGSATSRSSPMSTPGAFWAGGCRRSKTTPLVMSAVEQALFTRRRTDTRFTATGLVHHSDAGSQYTSLAFTERADRGRDHRLDRHRRRCPGQRAHGIDDRAVQDRGHRPRAADRTLGRPAEVETATASWVHWFNATRLHSSIGDLPPIEYEEAHHHRTRGSRDDYAETAVA